MEALREEVKEERRSKGLLEADSVPTTFPGEVLSVHEKVDMEGERKMKEAVEAGKTVPGGGDTDGQEGGGGADPEEGGGQAGGGEGRAGRGGGGDEEGVLLPG